MLGTFKADVRIVDNETLSVDGKHIKVVSNRDPLQLPWAELGIDIVIEVATILQYFSAPDVNYKNTCHGCQLTFFFFLFPINTNFLGVFA